MASFDVQNSMIHSNIGDSNAGLGSILDTVSKDTEDTTLSSILSVS